MNIAICCIGKLENRYIRDYALYYKKLGVNKIYLYDNNDKDGERFNDVIQDLIDEKYVEVIDVRGQLKAQMPCYHSCYQRFGSLYDWMLFIDCGDEYLCMKEYDNLNDFLSQPKFNNFSVIHINLMTMGDGGHLRYEPKPLMERITEPCLPLNFTKTYNFPENDHVSSIVRGKRLIAWRLTPHTPSNMLKCCDCKGKPVDSTSPFIHPFNFDVAYFKHFQTKTIEEWIDIKMRRGYPDSTKIDAARYITFEAFFKENKWTLEKQEIIDEYLKK